MDFAATEIVAANGAFTDGTAILTFVDASGQKLTLKSDVIKLSEAVSIVQKEQLRFANEALQQSVTIDRGDWRFGPTLDARNFRVGTTPIETVPWVVIEFDLNTRWTVAYRLPPEAADHLANQLRIHAAKAREKPTNLQ